MKDTGANESVQFKRAGKVGKEMNAKLTYINPINSDEMCSEKCFPLKSKSSKQREIFRHQNSNYTRTKRNSYIFER